MGDYRYFFTETPRSPQNHGMPSPGASLLKARGASLALRLKIAPKPYVVWSLGPKALTYESLEP